MTPEIQFRLNLAKTLVVDAGSLASRYFSSLGELQIEEKGHQDLVSDADKNVELFIRDALASAYPDDGIVGEEHEDVPSSSGYTWVIDPIDGTANFVRGIPVWTVVLACVHESRTKIGVIADPVHGEVFSASEGDGAYLNDKAIRVATTSGLHDGSIAVGFSNRTDTGNILRFNEKLVAKGGVFLRLASGAISLAWAACGRVNGYVEDHMNAWDCLAGQLLVKEAGGAVEEQNADDMLQHGGRVIVGSPSIFDDIVAIADESFQ